MAVIVTATKAVSMRNKRVDLVIKRTNELEMHTRGMVLWPRNWKAYRLTRHLNWQLRKFDASERYAIPDDSGVYSFLVQPGIAFHPACSYLMYIGQAKSLHRRFGDYLKERDDPNGRETMLELLNKWDGYLWFCFAHVPLTALDSTEYALIRSFWPPFNREYLARVLPPKKAF